MIERKLRLTANLTRRSSRFLSNELRNSYRLERRLQANSLRIKKKLVEERNRTLKALYRSSTEERKDRKGLSTFGGILGGGILANVLRRRSPSALLRRQKTPILSRGAKLSRFGRLGRIGPLAIIGTGLDFAGRRAEGQTNLQAGVGAAGGLGGALAGAKYGAILGTAVGGPIGTIVGGIGGSIVGGLAGGKLADLFTGADRRRQFEIEKNIILNQKTLFSDANDDLERVLDKFAIRVPRLDFAKRDDDDDRPRFLRIVIPTPIPREPVNVIKEFFKKPVVQDVSKIALVATALILSRGKLRGSEKAIVDLLRKKPATFTKLPLEKQLQVIVKDIKKQNLIDRISKSPFLTKRGTVVPGQKGAPGRVKKKTNIVKKEKQKDIEREQTKKIRESIKDMADFMKKSGFVEPSKLERRATELFNSDLRDLVIMKGKKQISQAQFDLAVNRLQLNLKITLDRIGQYSDAIREFSLNRKNFDASGNIIGKNLNDMIRKLDIFSGKVLPEINMENLIMKNLGPNIKRRLQDIIKRPKQDLIEKIKKEDFGPKNPTENFPDLSRLETSPDLSGDGTEIAMASDINQPSENNIFIGAGNQTQQQPQVTDGTTSEVQTVNISNTYDNVTKYAEMTALMTV